MKIISRWVYGLHHKLCEKLVKRDLAPRIDAIGSFRLTKLEYGEIRRHLYVALNNRVFIVRAAILVKSSVESTPNKIYSVASPGHHAEIYTIYHEEIRRNTNPGVAIQGFLTNTGLFVDRVQALAIAQEALQLFKESKYTSSNLYSEDLWSLTDELIQFKVLYCHHWLNTFGNFLRKIGL